MLGHNSSSYGQMLKPALPAAPKATKQRFPYFKFYPRDWIEATRDMTLEARGAYIDLICILMEMEGHLADNDGWISHQMHVSTRKWKSVKKQLVEHEKIRIDDGKIINERCLKELDSLLAQRRNLSDSALVRERTKRDPIVSQPRTDDEKSKKLNENNATATTVVPLRARVLDLDLDKEEEREEPPREGAFGKVAASILVGASVLTPIQAAAAHPVEQVMQGPAECWLGPKAAMAAGVSKQEADAQKQVWVTTTGGLEIAGAFKTEMERTFPLVDLTSALAAACVNVKIDSGAWNAMQVVRRQFGFMQQEALKDERRREANAARYGKGRSQEATFTPSRNIPTQKPRPLDEAE